MILQFAIVLAVAWVTAANPMAVYSRQSTNVAGLRNDRPGGSTNPFGIANATRTWLGVLAVASAWAHI